MCEIILVLSKILKKIESKSRDNLSEVSGTHIREKHIEQKEKEETKLRRKYTNQCFSPQTGDRNPLCI
jgi:hypothetical protein